MKLELWYPTNPYKVNQAWGIYNPAYLQFGFDRHNGIDIQYPENGKLLCPVEMCIVSQKYFSKGGGYQVEAITTKRFVVPHLDNAEHYIRFAFMHNKQFIHQVGDVLKVGDEIAIPDNTGFSTGPHIHMGAYRIKDDGTLLDVNSANNSFDFSPYWNGYYAGNANKVMATLQQILLLLQNFFKGR